MSVSLLRTLTIPRQCSKIIVTLFYRKIKGISPLTQSPLILKPCKFLLEPQNHLSSARLPSEGDFIETCQNTLDSLSEFFEELLETIPAFKNGDVTYSDGVLTVFLGEGFGTYVINRQTPNRQIWLSSPTSGPKRYDLVNDVWIYKHDSTTLHALLSKEISEISKTPINFPSLPSSKRH